MKYRNLWNKKDYKTWIIRRLQEGKSAKNPSCKDRSDITAVHTLANKFYFSHAHVLIQKSCRCSTRCRCTTPFRNTLPYVRSDLPLFASKCVLNPLCFFGLSLAWCQLSASWIQNRRTKCARNLCQTAATHLPSGPWHKRFGCLSSGTSDFSSHTVRTTDRRGLSTLCGEDNNCQNETEVCEIWKTVWKHVFRIRQRFSTYFLYRFAGPF